MKIHTVILAAGEGSRMLSSKAKSLQPVGGYSMLRRIYETVKDITNKTTFVVGYEKDSIIKESESFDGNINISEQKQAIGTADAVRSSLDTISADSKVLVLYGDVPLIKKNTLENLISMTDTGLTILTTQINDPTGYGRVKKDKDGMAQAIVEERDASMDEKLIKEIFTGILCCNKSLLEEAINEVENNNAAKEYYLTDIVSIINSKGFKINTCLVSSEEVQGANTKTELAELEEIYRKMKAEDLLQLGATLSDPSRVDIRGKVSVGKDCAIDINVILDGNVVLGNNVTIGPNTILKDVEIGDGSSVEAFSHLVSAKVGQGCSIGPYARLREGSQIDDGAKIGNFVETKKTKVGKNSKANHLAYLGDAEIGEDSNIGAGTITCNYDGKDKHPTKIGDKSFVGTNSSLVAPVTIGSNAYVAAGSVITKDIPDDALGVSRSKQDNKENWSKKKD
ncbi:MAG: UDP-N-acetylglucosamine diphosphorylase/glucosamine-1-phosphate N-acetyltransferase [Gammaproteobacteria bacterium]|nr:UDP-N-acetylglucosamine diphosphorylase/glucosamine-1-phosphate N-acetyltransferase [Gammaproteobacteria bacterium]